jgi:hypothetical protein
MRRAKNATKRLTPIKESNKRPKGSWEIFLDELNKNTPEPFKQPIFQIKKYTLPKKKTRSHLNRIRTTEKQNRNLLQKELDKNKNKNHLYIPRKKPLGSKI